MRRVLVLTLLPLLAATSAPLAPAASPIDDQLRRARSEQAAAEKEAARLQQAAAAARNDADRLRAEQAAAVSAIDAAEARITAADMQLRLASAQVAAQKQRLAEQQRPIASLLAGLAVMAERPPLLTMADRQAGVDELVKVRLLLNSTLPVIRARTAGLSAELQNARRLQLAAMTARDEVLSSRRDLATRRERFAALEQRALQLAQRSGNAALGASDAAIAAGETVEQLGGEQGSRRVAASLAAELASLDAAPARPSRAQGGPEKAPFAYQLPAAAAVTQGLGAVDENGVRSRGLTLETWRGAPVSAPAAGTVRFAGPYLDYDGVVIIDHGGGWLSLLVNVVSTLKPGDHVSLGDTVGRALGPLQVELSQSGRRISPALIAGSSQSLSKNPKGS